MIVEEGGLAMLPTVLGTTDTLVEDRPRGSLVRLWELVLLPTVCLLKLISLVKAEHSVFIAGK